jgi:hypothetical protein
MGSTPSRSPASLPISRNGDGQLHYRIVKKHTGTDKNRGADNVQDEIP